MYAHTRFGAPGSEAFGGLLLFSNKLHLEACKEDHGYRVEHCIVLCQDNRQKGDTISVENHHNSA